MRITLFAAFLAACGASEKGPPPVVTVPAVPAPPSSQSAPVPVAAPLPVAAAPRVVITKLSSAGASCGLDADGRLWTWGSGDLEPDRVALPAVRTIACWHDHSCILQADGGLACWGQNSYGALGDGTETPRTVPTPVLGLTSVTDFGLNFGRTCARTSNGDVYCWGDSEFGLAGDGRLPDNVGREKTKPEKAILTGTATLSVGSDHACSVMPDGRVSCWGQNNSGACGQPESTRYVPRPAFVPKLKDIASVWAGYATTCTIDRNGAVSCWGRLDSNAYHGVTRAIALPGRAVEVAMTESWYCARLDNGDVHCWEGRGAPTKMFERVSALSASFDRQCALAEGGRVFCWDRLTAVPVLMNP